MDRLLHKYLRKFVLIFFDDILIYNKNEDDHKQHLKLVLELPKQNKLSAKKNKCVFGQLQVEYLGHIISAQGVYTDPSKFQSMKEWPVPKNITELRGFWGLAGYYRRFIKDYGRICKPLFDSLKKGEFSWAGDQLSTFNRIKQALCSAPVLALPDFTKPFILETDASDRSIGAVLMQQGKPISFLSKSLGPKSTNMSTYDKEAMAIIEALKKWKHYLSEADLILRLDQ
jgi:hypothetical protein